jgi:hypothetical protein
MGYILCVMNNKSHATSQKGETIFWLLFFVQLSFSS